MPDKIIKNDQIQDDSWQFCLEAELDTLPEGDIVVPLKFWLENHARLSGRAGQLGVILNSDDEPEVLAPTVQSLALVAVNFPAFTDGRGYTIARLLRERYSFEGEIRAIGDVMLDQLFYMRRCGFSSYAIKEGKDIEEALGGLNAIGDSYQAAVDQPNPLFRRRA